MRFHIDHIVPKAEFSINHRSRIFLMGSCFSENIGSKLADHKFHVLANPNGILFNPLSVSQSLEAILNSETIDERFILQRDGVYYSYRHHSSVNARSKTELMAEINLRTKNSHEFLSTCDLLIITFGTAFYYRNNELKTAVANCHKQPLQVFEKRLLSVEEITATYSKLIDSLKTRHPTLRIIFTVSPVKYLRDGLEENNLSKATLTLSVHELVRKYSCCSYFPAYELVTDDLRDYRFYKEDLAHPNEQAIGYIWDKFSGCYFDEKTLKLNGLIARLHSALKHRPMQEGALETAKLLEFTEKLKSEIRVLDPEIGF